MMPNKYYRINFNNIPYKKNRNPQQAPMSGEDHFRTPIKRSTWQETAHETEQQQPPLSDRQFSIKIDYKAKTFSLMKRMTEYQLQERRQLQDIIHLQRELQHGQREIEEFLKTVGAKSFSEVAELIKKGSMAVRDERIENQVHQELSNIISQYKKIIEKSQVKLQFLEQDNRKNLIKIEKLEEALNSDKNSHNQLKKQYESLKLDFKQLLIENTDLQDLKQDIQSKYHSEIVHFEQLESHVEQKLKAVEKEMRYYQEEREEHLYSIEMLKKQLEARKLKEYFSFGGSQTKEVQVNLGENARLEGFAGSQQEIMWKPQNRDEECSTLSTQCFEASIKTLLEENARLKNALLTLYRSKGEQLPKETELEIRILMSTANSQEGE